MSTPRRKLIIDRRVWLRGEGSTGSRLLRAGDLKMCCVGIYLEACGVTNAQLLEKGEAGELGWDEEHDTNPNELPKEALWLVYADHRLYGTNDELGPEHIRERIIAKLFAEHGIDVEYVG